MKKIFLNFYSLYFRNKETDLGSTPVTVLLMRLSIPAILSMMTAAIYNVVDRIFVGQLNPLGLTAIGITMPVQIIQMAFVLMVGVGSATLISVECGRGDSAKAQRILDIAFYYFVITQLIVTVLGIVFLDPLFVLLNVSTEVFPYARIYTIITLLGGVPGLTGYCLNNAVRAMGHAQESMVYVIVSSAANIALDALFVLGLQWGVAGAAMATVLSQTLVTVFVLRFFCLHPIDPAWTIRRLFPANLLSDAAQTFSSVAEITHNGLPNLYMQIFGTIVNLLLNRSLIRYGGDYHMASMTIIQALNQFFLMAVYGVGQGAQPVFGYNFGAGKPQRTKEALTIALKFVTGVMLLVVALIFLFPNFFVGLFTGEAKLIATTVPNLMICLSVLPFVAIHSISATYFQSTKQPLYATALYILRFGGILIPALLVLPRIFGITGVYAANALSDGLSGLIACVLLIIRAKRKPCASS